MCKCLDLFKLLLKPCCCKFVLLSKMKNVQRRDVFVEIVAYKINGPERPD